MSNETHSDEIRELRKKFEKDSGGRVDEVKPGSRVGEHGSMKTLPELKYSCPTCGCYMDKPCEHWKAWIANPQPTQPAETHSEKGLRERLDEALWWQENRIAHDYGECREETDGQLCLGCARILELEQALAATPAVPMWSNEQRNLTETERKALRKFYAKAYSAPAVREPGPAITEAQAQDAYCDSFDTDAPAVAPAPDFKRLAKAINRFIAAPSSAGPAVLWCPKYGGTYDAEVNSCGIPCPDCGAAQPACGMAEQVWARTFPKVAPSSAGEVAPATLGELTIEGNATPDQGEAPAATAKGEAGT